MPGTVRFVAIGAPHQIPWRANYRAAAILSEFDREIYLERLAEPCQK